MLRKRDSMNVVFLDYDGVVNTPMWTHRSGKWVCLYNFPDDNRVNNLQAVQWVSEFCEKYGYSIVVTSTWRYDDNYKECLIKGGLRDGIKILGCTTVMRGWARGQEISQWLSEHPDTESYLVFDDDLIPEHKDRQVLCRSSAGFREEEFYKAETIHNNRWK